MHTIQKHTEAQDNQVLFSASRWTHPAWRPSDPSPPWLRPRCQGTCYTCYRGPQQPQGAGRGEGASGTEGRPRLQLCVGRGISRCLVNTGARDWLRRWENKEVSFTQSWAVVMDAQLCLALWLSRVIPGEASALHTQVQGALTRGEFSLDHRWALKIPPRVTACHAERQQDSSGPDSAWRPQHHLSFSSTQWEAQHTGKHVESKKITDLVAF